MRATVTRVIDGDTIQVDIGGSPYRVRYIGIDAPEVGQRGYPEATEANASLVANRIVELEKDVSETDRYGRLLRYVWVDGHMVNAVLVYNGYAQATTYPPDVNYQDDFLALQRRAEAEGRGLWAVSEPATPSAPTESTGPQGAYRFVGSVNSDVYHYPTCRYAGQIYDSNKVWFVSPADARASGYRPCKVCNPP